MLSHIITSWVCLTIGPYFVHCFIILFAVKKNVNGGALIRHFQTHSYLMVLVPKLPSSPMNFPINFPFDPHVCVLNLWISRKKQGENHHGCHVATLPLCSRLSPTMFPQNPPEAPRPHPRSIGQTTRGSSTTGRTNQRRHPFDLRRRAAVGAVEGWYGEPWDFWCPGAEEQHWVMGSIVNIYEVWVLLWRCVLGYGDHLGYLTGIQFGYNSRDVQSAWNWEAMG